MRIIEASLAILIIFSFLIFILNLEIEKDESFFVKQRIYKILELENYKIRELAFLNKTKEIEEIIKNYLKGYNITAIICKDFCYFENNAKNVYSVTYFFSTNFTHYENLKLIIYAWKI